MRMLFLNLETRCVKRPSFFPDVKSFQRDISDTGHLFAVCDHCLSFLLGIHLSTRWLFGGRQVFKYKQTPVISPLYARFGIRVSLITLSAMALIWLILLDYNSAADWAWTQSGPGSRPAIKLARRTHLDNVNIMSSLDAAAIRGQTYPNLAVVILLAIGTLLMLVTSISAPILSSVKMFRLTSDVNGISRYVDVGLWGYCVVPVKRRVACATFSRWLIQSSII